MLWYVSRTSQSGQKESEQKLMANDIKDILQTWTVNLEENNQTIHAFKAVFLTEQGQYVLARMLEKLKFLEHCDNERDMELNNFAKDLLATIYWNEEVSCADTGRIMNFLKGIKSIFKKWRTK